MDLHDTISQLDLSALGVLRYPDPRLQEAAQELARVDGRVRRLAERMCELMLASAGVGLAATQIGVSARLFIASETSDEGDWRVYVNPSIVSAEGRRDGDEGCLSLPGLSCKIRRNAVVTIRAMGLDGEWFVETGEDLLARIFQHEIDHLDGRLLIDRMGSVAKLANRRLLKGLEDVFGKVKA